MLRDRDESETQPETETETDQSDGFDGSRDQPLTPTPRTMRMERNSNSNSYGSNNNIVTACKNCNNNKSINSRLSFWRVVTIYAKSLQASFQYLRRDFYLQEEDTTTIYSQIYITLYIYTYIFVCLCISVCVHVYGLYTIIAVESIKYIDCGMSIRH